MSSYFSLDSLYNGLNRLSDTSVATSLAVAVVGLYNGKINTNPTYGRVVVGGAYVALACTIGYKAIEMYKSYNKVVSVVTPSE
jgi:hypothetical protein